MKKKLVLPKFKNEDEERKFWDKIDITDYYEPGDFVRVRFPNLKPTTTPISIRLPNHMISELKIRANRLNVPYQALIKQAIADKLNSPKNEK
jgi:predicted DNA binding CopG/RHH family protein